MGGGGGLGVYFVYFIVMMAVCCQNSMIRVFIVIINRNCIICIVTDGYNVWVPVGLPCCVYAGRYVLVCVCVCVSWG